MTKYVYIKTALTGGGLDALDGIDGANLVDGHVAYVYMNGIKYEYILDADSGAAEDSPNVIAPDTNAGDKRWILQGATFESVTLQSTPTADAHAATKEYVDSAVAASVWTFFLTDDSADVSGYYYLKDEETGETLSELTSPTLSAGDDQLLWSFVTESGDPGIDLLSLGVYTATMFLYKSGNKTVNIYWKLFKRDSGDVETELMTSGISDDLIDSRSQYILSSYINSDVTLDTTDRIVLKLYANVSGTGTDPTVTISMENNYDSRIALRVGTSAFANVFAKLTNFQRGTGTFGGPNGTTVAINDVGTTDYQVVIQPLSQSGFIGEISVESKAANSFVVKNSGSDTTTQFDWILNV